jgi:hypothetical protein
VNVEHEAHTIAESQTDAQKIRSDVRLMELIRLWRWLSGDIQQAFLGMARASTRQKPDQGMMTRPELKEVLQGVPRDVWLRWVRVEVPTHRSKWRSFRNDLAR